MKSVSSSCNYVCGIYQGAQVYVCISDKERDDYDINIESDSDIYAAAFEAAKPRYYLAFTPHSTAAP